MADGMSASSAARSPYFGDVDAASVKEAQSLGLKVVVWTVNTEADMRRIVALGVDGIISDYPDVLRRVAGECGFTLPAPTPITAPKRSRPHAATEFRVRSCDRRVTDVRINSF